MPEEFEEAMEPAADAKSAYFKCPNCGRELCAKLMDEEEEPEPESEFEEPAVARARTAVSKQMKGMTETAY